MAFVRIIVNWTVLFLSPVWCIPVFLWFVFNDKKGSMTQAIFFEGEKWFWAD